MTANLKISQLNAAETLTGAELIECVQDGANVQTTPAALKTFIGDAAPTGEGQNDGLLTHEDKAKLDGIESGATADQTAQEVSFSPEGNIAATNVQAAIEELDAEKLAITDAAAITYLAAIVSGAL